MLLLRVLLTASLFVLSFARELASKNGEFASSALHLSQNAYKSNQTGLIVVGSETNSYPVLVTISDLKSSDELYIRGYCELQHHRAESPPAKIFEHAPKVQLVRPGQNTTFEMDHPGWYGIYAFPAKENDEVRGGFVVEFGVPQMRPVPYSRTLSRSLLKVLFWIVVPNFVLSKLKHRGPFTIVHMFGAFLVYTICLTWGTIGWSLTKNYFFNGHLKTSKLVERYVNSEPEAWRLAIFAYVVSRDAIGRKTLRTLYVLVALNYLFPPSIFSIPTLEMIVSNYMAAALWALYVFVTVCLRVGLTVFIALRLFWRSTSKDSVHAQESLSTEYTRLLIVYLLQAAAPVVLGAACLFGVDFNLWDHAVLSFLDMFTVRSLFNMRFTQDEQTRSTTNARDAMVTKV
ncbi:hypothetical protein SJAG_02190 [Schizosaccharomyces japonicus yFS275]|uniref:Uncharacterized protein n=1 Tax=Schizosaccharomyces japonicus (strain yFS275 / FY16936) TaxID=402676 RepID=B6K1S8_SCHJY|nr:hypothetical protein SJAG_02190 [Schizosaccharomyces japonicus yFS275]EEB07109.1 hypothetical protein SJAG_02190 [Schizosaccharomyces japonicus yFS275]